MSGERQDLGRRVAHSLLWAATATMVGRMVGLLSLALLARLLVPEQFGLMAAALVLLTYLETVGDLGTAAALVYWPGEEEEAARVTFAVNLLMATVWFALLTLVAGPAAGFFHQPEAAPVLRALAWSFPIKALGATNDALCVRRLRFRARLVPEVAMPVVKAVVALVLAYAGWGVWSLVWGQLAGLMAWTGLLWVLVPWRPVLALPRQPLRSMLRYGRGLVTVNVLAAVVHHADVVVVGRFLGAATLGFYQMAYKLPEASLAMIARVVSKVLFPAFAKLRDSQTGLRRGYLTGLRAVSLLALPAAVALALLAEPLVLLFFGPDWGPTVPLLRVLALYFGVRAVGSQSGDVLKATGRTGLLAALGVLKAAILIPSLLVGVRFGAMGVATAMAANATLGTLLNFAAVARVARIEARQLAGALRLGLGVAVAMAIGLGLWSRLAPGAVVELVVGGLFGGTLLLVAGRVWSPDLWWMVVPGGRSKSRAGRRDRDEVVVGETGRFLVPLQEKPVVRFFLESMLVPHGLRQRLATAAAPWLGVPLCTLLVFERRRCWQLQAETGDDGTPARPPEDGREEPHLRQVRELLGDGAKLVRGTGLEGRWPLQWILRSSYPGSERSRMLLLLLDEGEPVAALKLRPPFAAGGSLLLEERALRWAHARLPEELRRCIPLPYSRREVGGLESLLLGYRPGSSAYTEMHRSLRPGRRVATHLRGAAGWLARLHRASRLPGSEISMLSELRDRLGISTPEPEAAWYEELRSRLRAYPLARCAAHGDYWAGNLVFGRSPSLAGDGSAGTAGDLVEGVIDWEHADSDALPLDDLFHFPISYGLSYPWKRYRRIPAAAALRRTLLGGSREVVAREVRAYFRIYCAATATDARLLELLFCLFATSGLFARRYAKLGAGEDVWQELHEAILAADESAFSFPAPFAAERPGSTPQPALGGTA